jgi:hypothetical protein
MLSSENAEINKTRPAKLLSAFFGLDNAMPLISMGIWMEAPGKDGMPLVFSHEIDPETLKSTHFQITTTQGDTLLVDFASFQPAIEEFELRTVLLIGEFGNAPGNEPAEVSVIGDLKSRDGQSLKGQQIRVTPLAEGPFISYAEYFFLDKNYPYREEGRGCDCPKLKTSVVVRTVWAGGVRAVNGEELGENELSSFTISFLQASDTIEVHPFQIADLNDNDNNIDLCIKEKGIPLKVEAKEGIAIDPRDDENPHTSIEVYGRWE